MKMRQLIKIVCFVLVCTHENAFAVHGTHPTGYGAKSVSMGGTAVANPQDSLVLAANPSGISFLCDRMDIGLQWFNPHRAYGYTGSDTIPKDFVISQRDDFFIPNLGFLKHFDERNTFGAGLYGRGVNTTYPRDNPVFGDGDIAQILQFDYIQFLCAPTYSLCVTENQAIGLSLLVGAQRLRVKGLQGFRAFSSSPDHVTNKGYDWAGGVGVRIGWTGEVFKDLFFGISYSSKVYMSKFHKYRGLIAERGKIDMPAEFLAGVSFRVTDCLVLAFDYQCIFFEDVAALSHSIGRLSPGNLGTNAGAGFGWNNISIYKLGVNYCITPCWEIKAGYSYGNVPYSSKQMDPNIVAPLVTQSHLSLGFTYYIPEFCGEWDVAFVHGFKNVKRGNSVVGLGRVKEELSRNSLIIQYGFEI